MSLRTSLSFAKTERSPIKQERGFISGLNTSACRAIFPCTKLPNDFILTTGTFSLKVIYPKVSVSWKLAANAHDVHSLGLCQSRQKFTRHLCPSLGLLTPRSLNGILASAAQTLSLTVHLYSQLPSHSGFALPSAS